MEAPFLPPVSAGLFWCLVFDVCPTVRSGVNAGAKMHRLAGAKIHQ
jgi:hypothetical protein